MKVIKKELVNDDEVCKIEFRNDNLMFLCEDIRIEDIELYFVSFLSINFFHFIHFTSLHFILYFLYTVIR